MALGSSAPEILLSVIGTVKDIEAIPGELGPSTIVGSAAFNLLCITGVSIIAVGGDNDEIKKVDDLMVFFVTSVLSLWAYVWLFICVQDKQVTVVEGILTIVFFIVLVVFAYAADRLNAKWAAEKRSQEDIEQAETDAMIKRKKDRLRQFARQYSENTVIEVA